LKFKESGIIQAIRCDEKAAYFKELPDGTCWEKIHWLDISHDTSLFANIDEVKTCLNQANRYSKMWNLDSYKINN
jgi:hypothetical protein